MARTAAIVTCVLVASACEPEVGSERWCEMMRAKPRGDWSTNEALDFARYCILEGDEE
jgi:hypothetical protein